MKSTSKSHVERVVSHILTTMHKENIGTSTRTLLLQAVREPAIVGGTRGTPEEAQVGSTLLPYFLSK